MTLPHSWRFEAIGTGWQIDAPQPLGGVLEAAILDRIAGFDRTYSRFRDDSLVARITTTPGRHVFPDDAAALFDVYRALYEATDGAMSPLVGAALDRLGYDRAYSLRSTGPAIPAPDWDAAVAWDGTALTTLRPVSVDVGAAGKGYLVDIVAAMLVASGVEEFIVDASGDIAHRGAEPIRVGLEHPLDTTKAIGVVSIGNGAICASASNRRVWGDGLHHVLDATTGLPTRGIIATWAMAETALAADALATALFFADPARLAKRFEFSYVRMHATGRVESSPHLDGELFT
ncbi:FAD:protein FMN transferase [Leifsonia sp. H3M29-4]|uniref:FAD:protein FMN transferase n=1 Tax=Salinibacterium metalliresistens TaxID=3031321 RepID=UPI0023DC98EB|nr:FAD:protein FMN transferase [Salinibacterium metalliresistens]MDF1478293.1 FAD:protein FMN transferase [Salinibacterium metalliresistens]